MSLWEWVEVCGPRACIAHDWKLIDHQKIRRLSSDSHSHHQVHVSRTYTRCPADDVPVSAAADAATSGTGESKSDTAW